MPRDIEISDLQESELQETAEVIATSFREAKPDSLVCRMPKSLVIAYLREVLAEGGRVLIARRAEEPVGFLVFVRDNNVSLRFLRRHKFQVVLGLLSSTKLKDKKLLVEATLSAMRMGDEALPSEFKNEISLLAVMPWHTGRGIGSLLVQQLLSTQDGDINVKTVIQNLGAINFYRRTGFVQTGSLRVGTRTLVCFKRA